MRVEEAKQADLEEIISLIKTDFPYVERGLEKLKQKIEDGEIVIFTASEGKKILGFIELQFLEGSIARINGLSVKDETQGKGVGKNLLDHAISFLKTKGTERIILLVKESNEKAKELYKSRGFEFIGLYHRRIDQAVVEEMELGLGGEAPAYVS